MQSLFYVGEMCRIRLPIIVLEDDAKFKNNFLGST